MLRLVIACVLGLTLTTGCLVHGRRGYVAAMAPPALKVEWYQDRPKHVFVHGNWAWVNSAWVWEDGYWIEERPGRVWVEGSWFFEGGNYRWHPGYWRTDVGR